MPETENPTAAPAPATTPAVPAFDFEAFKAEFDSKMDQRISGLQSTYDRKLAERDAIIEQLKTANLSEDEREQLAASEASEHVKSLETQLWLASEASKKYPTAASHLQKLIETDGDVVAFAEYLESALKPAPAPEPEPVISDVDPNNAPRTPVSLASDSFVGPDGQVYTAELQRQILEGFGSMSLAEIRSKG